MHKSPEPQTTFCEENEDELKALATALVVPKAGELAAAASALLVKVWTGSSIAAGAAEKAVTKAFGQWFADTPDARLLAAARTYREAHEDRVALHRFAAAVRPLIDKASEDAARALAAMQQGQQILLGDQHEGFDILARAMWEALDGVGRLELGQAELIAAVAQLRASVEHRSDNVGSASAGRPGDPLQTVVLDGDARSEQRSTFVSPSIKPNLPAKWVARPEVDALVRHVIRAPSASKLAQTSGCTMALPAGDPSLLGAFSESTRIVLHGYGGFGKTALAIALCHDPRVEASFRDGILWVTLGQTPDVPGLLNEQVRRLQGGLAPAHDPLKAESSFRELIEDKRLLLVLDDVWKEQHAQPFLVATRGATVITTRIRSLPEALNAAEFPVERMGAVTAAELLLQWLPLPQRRAEAASLVAPLVTLLHGWPLLLKLTGGFLGQQVKAARSLKDAVLEATGRLEALGTAAFREHRATARERSLETCLMLCFDGKNSVAGDDVEELRARFEELGVFAEDKDIPLGTVARLWRRTAGLQKYAADEVLARLADFGLFDRFDLSAGGWLRLHDVVRDLLQRRAHNLSELHEALLASYEVAHFADLPCDDNYVWDQVVMHVREARGRDASRALLLDPRWLRAKLEARGLDSVLADFRTFGVFDRTNLSMVPERYDMDLVVDEVFESFQLSASVLRTRPAELEVQLLARIPFTRDIQSHSLRSALLSTLQPPLYHCVGRHWHILEDRYLRRYLGIQVKFTVRFS